MTYNEESYLLNTLTDIAKETHENNVMLRFIVKYINSVISKRGNDEEEEFGRNVMANIMSEVFDNLKGRLRNGK